MTPNRGFIDFIWGINQTYLRRFRPNAQIINAKQLIETSLQRSGIVRAVEVINAQY